MAAARSKLDKPKVAARIVAWVSDGKSDAQVAALLGRQRVKASRQAITAFRRRHADELTSVVEQAVAVIQDAAIVDKADRIRRRQWYVDQLEGVMRDRGPLAVEPKWITVYGEHEDPDDEDSPIVTKRELTEVARVDTALYRTADELLNSTAKELGETKGDEGGVHLTQITYNDNRKQTVRTDGRRSRIIDADPT